MRGKDIHRHLDLYISNEGRRKHADVHWPTRPITGCVKVSNVHPSDLSLEALMRLQASNSNK